MHLEESKFFWVHQNKLKGEHGKPFTVCAFFCSSLPDQVEQMSLLLEQFRVEAFSAKP